MVPRSVLAGRYHLQPDSWKVNLYYLVRAWDLLNVHGRDLLDLLLGRRGKREVALRESELIAYLNWVAVRQDGEKKTAPRSAGRC